jgi:hypothetical protein
MSVELIPYDLAVPDLGEHRARHRLSLPGRGWSPRDGSQAFDVGAAHPLDEDAIALGEDAEHLESDIREDRYEALVASDAPCFVHKDELPGCSAA